jgi:hypothetical protein
MMQSDNRPSRKDVMMELTSQAREYLATSLEGARVSDTDDTCFRITLSDRGEPRLTLSRPLPDDTTFKHDDRVVFALASAVAPRFTEHTFDLKIDEEGKKQIIMYPTPSA